MSILDKTGFVFFGFSENLDSASQPDLEQVASVVGSNRCRETNDACYPWGSIILGENIIISARFMMWQG